MDRGRKYDHERSDEGPQGVETAPGSSSAKRRMECTTRRHVGSGKVSVSVKAYTKDEADSNASLFRRVARRVLYCGKLSHIVGNKSERVVDRTSVSQCQRFWKRSPNMRQLSTCPSCRSNSFFLFNGVETSKRRSVVRIEFFFWFFIVSWDLFYYFFCFFFWSMVVTFFCGMDRLHSD